MSTHVPFGDDFVFSDIRAAFVMDDGSIVRTLNGVPMTAGTSLFLRTPLEQAAPMLLEACRLLAAYDDGDPDDFMQLTLAYNSAVDAARNAIAAATGENA